MQHAYTGLIQPTLHDRSEFQLNAKCHQERLAAMQHRDQSRGTIALLADPTNL
jgi:hypothetical protein